MNRVIWTQVALSNLRAIRAYIEQSNPKAAATVAAQLLATGNSLTDFPRRGRTVTGTDMRELVTVHPYIIRYRVTADAVVILRLRHTSRRPTDP